MSGHQKSGTAGGFIEKIAAAKNKNIPVYIVGQSVQDDGMSFEAVCEYIDSNITSFISCLPALEWEMMLV